MTAIGTVAINNLGFLSAREDISTGAVLFADPNYFYFNMSLSEAQTRSNIMRRISQLQRLRRDSAVLCNCNVDVVLEAFMREKICSLNNSTCINITKAVMLPPNRGHEDLADHVYYWKLDASKIFDCSSELSANTSHMLYFDSVSKMKHSCCPNTVIEITEEGGIIVRASMNIKRNQLITRCKLPYSYIDMETRRLKLFQSQFQPQVSASSPSHADTSGVKPDGLCDCIPCTMGRSFPYFAAIDDLTRINVRKLSKAMRSHIAAMNSGVNSSPTVALLSVLDILQTLLFTMSKLSFCDILFLTDIHLRSAAYLLSLGYSGRGLAQLALAANLSTRAFGSDSTATSKIFGIVRQHQADTFVFKSDKHNSVNCYNMVDYLLEIYNYNRCADWDGTIFEEDAENLIGEVNSFCDDAARNLLKCKFIKVEDIMASYEAALPERSISTEAYSAIVDRITRPFHKGTKLHMTVHASSVHNNVQASQNHNDQIGGKTATENIINKAKQHIISKQARAQNRKVRVTSVSSSDDSDLDVQIEIIVMGRVRELSSKKVVLLSPENSFLKKNFSSDSIALKKLPSSEKSDNSIEVKEFVQTNPNYRYKFLKDNSGDEIIDNCMVIKEISKKVDTSKKNSLVCQVPLPNTRASFGCDVDDEI